jgi:putative MFS transporter
MLRRTLLAMTVGIIMPTCLYGFNGWIPTFLVKQGHSIASTLYFTALMGLGAPAGAYLGSVIADRVGRRPGIIGLSLLWAGFGIAYAFATTQAEIIGYGIGVVVGAYALNSVCYAIYVPELFPTRLRLRGTATAGAAGRLASAGAQYAVVWAFTFGGVGAVATGLAALLVFQALVLALFGIETRQRSLEDLSAHIGHDPIDFPLAAAPAKEPG